MLHPLFSTWIFENAFHTRICLCALALPLFNQIINHCENVSSGFAVTSHSLLDLLNAGSHDVLVASVFLLGNLQLFDGVMAPSQAMGCPSQSLRSKFNTGATAHARGEELRTT